MQQWKDIDAQKFEVFYFIVYWKQIMKANKNVKNGEGEYQCISSKMNNENWNEYSDWIAWSHLIL